MTEQAHRGTSAEQAAREPQPQLSNHRVVRSEDLPRFSIGTPVAVGITIWLVLLAAGIVRHDQLAHDGHTWWIWTAVTGVVLGLLGWLYITFRLRDQPGQLMEPDQPSDPPA